MLSVSVTVHLHLHVKRLMSVMCKTNTELSNMGFLSQNEQMHSCPKSVPILKGSFEIWVPASILGQKEQKKTQRKLLE